jgi:hypothetical protein
MPNPRITIALSLSFAWLLLGRRAAGEEERCTRVRVQAASGLGAAWAQATDDLRDEVTRLGRAECVDLSIQVEPERRGARIVVSSADGRRAERAVARPASLVAVATGIVASIPAESPSAETPPTESSDAPTPQEMPPPDEPPRKTAPPAPPVPPATLGLALGGRVGFPTGVLAPELEVRADVRFDGWIVALAGRGAPTGQRPFANGIQGYDYKEFSFGIAGGRRVATFFGALDLTAGPRVGIITEEGDVPADGVGGTLTDLWLQTSARAVLGRSGRWRPTVALDLDAAPGRLAKPGIVDAALPPLPSWSAGIRIGAAGDVP